MSIPKYVAVVMLKSLKQKQTNIFRFKKFIFFLVYLL